MKAAMLVCFILALALLGLSCATEAAAEGPIIEAGNETSTENKDVSTVTMVTAFATLGLVIVALGQLYFLRKSITESVKARAASVLLSIYDIMQDLRPSWLELYTYPDDFKLWNKGQRDLADRVGVGLQQVSYLCLEELIDPGYVRGNWAGTFVKCWGKLEHYIKAYRVQSGEPRELAEGGVQRRHFELFAKQCKDVYKF